jgi:outer membrane protein OmpA-like peptidoglycan-associated protein
VLKLSRSVWVSRGLRASVAAFLAVGMGPGLATPAPQPGPECALVADLNPAYFGTSAFGLNRNARDRLAENAEVLALCPQLCAEVVGFADSHEPNPERISGRRAEAVLAFYRDRGVAEGRVRARGAGVAPDDAYGEDRGVGSRRVESVPHTCR